MNAFNILLDKFEEDKTHYITLPNPPLKIFLFFDSVHISKNIRNSLLNKKNFVSVSSEEGYAAWSDLYKAYNKDNALNAKLRKAPNITFKAIHPSENKQNVNLAVAIFHETTIAARESYFPDRADMSNFLRLISCWWTIANSRKRSHLIFWTMQSF